LEPRASCMPKLLSSWDLNPGVPVRPTFDSLPCPDPVCQCPPSLGCGQRLSPWPPALGGRQGASVPLVLQAALEKSGTPASMCAGAGGRGCHICSYRSQVGDWEPVKDVWPHGGCSCESRTHSLRFGGHQTLGPETLLRIGLAWPPTSPHTRASPRGQVWPQQP
jgi:hypothetical protein